MGWSPSSTRPLPIWLDDPLRSAAIAGASLGAFTGRTVAQCVTKNSPMAVALRENRVIRGVEAIAERPDGTRFRFTPYPTPIHDALGAVKSGINLLVIAKR